MYSKEERQRFSKKEKRDRKKHAFVARLAKQHSSGTDNRMQGATALPEPVLHFTGDLEQALLAELDSTTAMSSNGQKVLSNKKRQAMAEKEAAMFQAVLTHQAFQADPLQSIAQHVNNTLAQQKMASEKTKKLDEQHRRLEMRRERKKAKSSQ